MSTLKYLAILASVLLAVAVLTWGVLTWSNIVVITTTHLAFVFGGFWLLGLISTGIMKVMGTDTPSQLMRFIMVSKTVRIMVSLLGLVGFTLFQESSEIFPFVIIVFIGYIASLLVESWYYLKTS